jgi:transposase InsO family protein
MESTIGLYKTELIDWQDRSWTGRSEVERETASWVHWFNTTRLHSSIGYTPRSSTNSNTVNPPPRPPRSPRWPKRSLLQIQGGSYTVSLRTSERPAKQPLQRPDKRGDLR